MSKISKWEHSFLSTWKELKGRNANQILISVSTKELYDLCAVELGKTWATRILHKAQEREARND